MSDLSLADAITAERETSAALRLPEAALYIGMSESWLAHSDVPRVRLGRAVRYLRSDLDAYLQQRRDRDVA